MQLVLFEHLDGHRPKRVEADVERHPLHVQPFEQLGGEVETGGRSCGGAFLLGVDGLVALWLGERLGDVRRQGHLA